MNLFAIAKGSNESTFDSYSVRNSVWSYPILPFGIAACTFFLTTFLEIAVCFQSVNTKEDDISEVHDA